MPDLDRVAALERAVRAVRDGDPLRPVAVLVPNPLQGLWLARRIFADTGHIGIDFLLPRELAWRVAMPGLLHEGRARIPENVDLALLLAAIPGAIADPSTPAYLPTRPARPASGPRRCVPSETSRPLASTRTRWRQPPQPTPSACGCSRASSAGIARPSRALVSSRTRTSIGARPRRCPRRAWARSSSVACDDLPPVESAFLDALRAEHRLGVVDTAVPDAVAPRTAGRAGAQLELFGVAPSPGTAAPKTALQRIQVSALRARRRPRRPTERSVSSRPRARRSRPSRSRGSFSGRGRGRPLRGGRGPPAQPRRVRRRARGRVRSRRHRGLLRRGHPAHRPRRARSLAAPRPRRRRPRSRARHGVPHVRARALDGDPGRGRRRQPRRASTGSPRGPGSCRAWRPGARAWHARAGPRGPPSSRTIATCASTTACCA